MATLEELTLYFYIVGGVTAALLLLIFILLTILFVRVNRLISDKRAYMRREYSRSNQLAKQREMMADFCYTNPTIVPGEELSRRGFSMYSGSNHQYTSDEIDIHGKDYTHQEEGRSKF